MASIPCADYVQPPIGLVPARIVCTERTCIANRFVGFCFSIDLSQNQKDEVGAGVGAWSLWDIPASHAAQIDDDRGEDLICVSIMDKVYWLDYERYIDEWDWNSYAPIYRMLRIGPVPYAPDQTQQGGYDLDALKRFREFQFALADGSTGAAGAKWTISVGDFQREAVTTRSTQRKTTNRMRTQIAVKGKAFMITLEHSANEPVNITDWFAAWDTLGKRIREASKA